MRRHHLHTGLRDANLSSFEEGAALTGLLLILVALVLAVAHGDAAGAARLLGSAGLVAFVICAASRGVREYRAGVTASLPKSVARVGVRARPLRLFSVVTAALALGLPLAAGAAVVGLFERGWLVVAGVAMVGCVAMFVRWLNETRLGEDSYRNPEEKAEELLRRLCMRADMRLPALVVTWSPVATAWTARGRIHVTTRLLNLLDDAELEAVLAHELAHLAHRDAAVMDICSAPSRVLLAFSRSMASKLRWLRSAADFPGGAWVMAVIFAVNAVLVPAAFLVGWTSRLSVLGISRAREFAADAAAVTLTGRPSALASALLKLDGQGGWAPRTDLRHVEGDAVLCIVGPARRRLGRLFATHPPTERRIRRLEDIELRITGRAA